MKKIDRLIRKTKIKQMYNELLQKKMPKMWIIFTVAEQFHLSEEQTRRILKQA